MNIEQNEVARHYQELGIKFLMPHAALRTLVAVEATLVGSESRNQARSVTRTGSIDYERRRPMAQDTPNTAGLPSQKKFWPPG